MKNGSPVLSFLVASIAASCSLPPLPQLSPESSAAAPSPAPSKTSRPTPTPTLDLDPSKIGIMPTGCNPATGSIPPPEYFGHASGSVLTEAEAIASRSFKIVWGAVDPSSPAGDIERSQSTLLAVFRFGSGVEAEIDIHRLVVRANINGPSGYSMRAPLAISAWTHKTLRAGIYFIASMDALWPSRRDHKDSSWDSVDGDWIIQKKITLIVLRETFVTVIADTRCLAVGDVISVTVVDIRRVDGVVLHPTGFPVVGNNLRVVR